MTPTNTAAWSGETMTQEQFMQKDTVLVLDEQDNVIGSASKKDSHVFNDEQPRGILHRAFSVFLFNEKDELLLQQRASSKITFPYVWTNTCCSHPLHGLEPSEVDGPKDVADGSVMGVKHAAVRKLWHELGIPAEQVPAEKFKFLTRLHYWAADTVTHGKDSPWGEHEIDYVLFIKVPKDSLTINPHPDEVEAVQWVSKKQLLHLLSVASDETTITEGNKNSLWSPWFRLIAHRWLLPDGTGWWDNLDDVLHTDKFNDYENVHKFDPPKEHMGGGGNAGEWLGQLQMNKKIHTSSISFLWSNSVFALSIALTIYSLINVVELLHLFEMTSWLRRKDNVTFQSTMQTLIFCFLYNFVIVVHFRNRLLHKHRKPIPHVPVEIPLLGNIRSFLTSVPWDLMERWHDEYGPIYQYTLLGRNCIALAHPTHLRSVLQSKIKSVKKDVGFAYKPFMPILGSGIVTSEGKSWMRQRLSISSVLRINVLEDIPRITLCAVQRLFRILDEHSEDGKEVDLSELLRHLTLQVISETFFSLPAEESNTTFAKMYLPIVEEGNIRVWHPHREYCFFLPFWWKHLRAVAKLNSYVESLIHRRWSNHNNENINDVLSKMFTALIKHDSSLVKKAELPRTVVVQLRDELKTFMLAGHETSAAMLTWSLFSIINDNTTLEDQLVSEASSVFDNSKDWLNMSSSNIPDRVEELSKLGLSEGALRESLRLYSVVPTVTRRAVEDIPLQGNFVVPKGATIMINIQSVHHNPIYWPDPLKYDPYRFVNGNVKHQPYTFLPFIDGPRNCLGQYLALLESKMVLSLLLQRYRFSMGQQFEKGKHGIDLRHPYMVPVIPEKGLHVHVQRR